MKAKIDMMNDIAKRTNMKIEIKKYKQYCLRMWLGIKLILFAAHIMNANLEIQTEFPEDSNG